LKEKGGKQGWKGHIDAKTDVVMDDIELLVRRAEDDGIGEEVPKYLLGHSLGGLMIIYFALTQDLSRLSGLISIGKKMTRQHV
jgi:alpha-beta hydrolase superfamily lysophospholipase